MTSVTTVEPHFPLKWKVLHLYLIIIFIYFTITTLSTHLVGQGPQRFRRLEAKPLLRRPLLGLLSCLLSSYLVEIGVMGTRSVLAPEWLIHEEVMVNNLSCVLIYGTQVLLLSKSGLALSYAFYGSWLIALPFELSIWNGISSGISNQIFLQLSLHLVFMSRCISLALLGMWPVFGTGNSASANENNSGLYRQNNGAQVRRWGNALQQLHRKAFEAIMERVGRNDHWLPCLNNYKFLLPYIWPFHDPSLQIRVVGIVICLIISTALKVLKPRQMGIIMDTQTDDNAWAALAAVGEFAGMTLASSPSGVDSLREWLWKPVQYYSYRALTQAAYSHALRLSADYHNSRSPADISVAIEDSRAVVEILDIVLFQTIPMLIDLVLAVIYLSWIFGIYEGLIVVASCAAFLVCTLTLVERSKRNSDEEHSSWNNERKLRQSGLSGWECVNIFNRLNYEENRYAEAVNMRWSKRLNKDHASNVSQALQILILAVGLGASMSLAFFKVRNGSATSGQLTVLLTYWNQLATPLKFLARLPRSIANNVSYAKNLLDLMQQQPSIQSKKGAPPLKSLVGEVIFANACFSYDHKKDILSGVCFRVPAGNTVALVGKTGAGKTTLIKLLCRLYDVTGGSVTIDRHDVREVDLHSLRERIGVVPQSPILFKDTIMNNVRYARLTATDEEVIEACRAAYIHDSIEGFSDGYETIVGERGMKLLSGEIQRMAIARAILKTPDLVLLDEATSAVDSVTEQQIQRSLHALCRDRTTVVVAHRLSTIMKADNIIVIADGQVVEQGPHEELVAANRHYADFWSKQVFPITADH